jgi:hypothetical protein
MFVQIAGATYKELRSKCTTLNEPSNKQPMEEIRNNIPTIIDAFAQRAQQE